MSICVVIPSIRNPNVIRDYLNNAIAHKFPLDHLEIVILTEDFVDLKPYLKVLAEFKVSYNIFNDITRKVWMSSHKLAKYTHLIPARSHAETSFGIIYSLVQGHDYTIFIDDDTRPLDSVDFFGSHLKTLSAGDSYSVVWSDTQWVNVLNPYPGPSNNSHNLHPRGYPFSLAHETPFLALERKYYTNRVMMSQGLWTNIPDLDAVRILFDGDMNGQSKTRLQQSYYSNSNFIVEVRNYLTVCSMNLAFSNKIAPIFYQFPMDDNEWQIGRFDDIWSGIVAKKIFDIAGYAISTTHPLVEHDKAPRSTFKDLKAEMPAYELNESFWKIIDVTYVDDSWSIIDNAKSIAQSLELQGDHFHPFIIQCGKYYNQWLEMIEKVI